ncbi:MAG: hypothetical protein GY820_03300 [Gammaproteobacteria bacterium]|nr:hypothetical protein [Gammaproteobacteria bacterium]
MTTIEFILFSTVLGSCFIAMILILVFARVTVRKLKNNPETMDALGLEYISGSNILNVVRVLAMPANRANKVSQNTMSFLYADAVILRKHTTKFDRILAIVLYCCLWFFLVGMTFLVLLSMLGVFEAG